MTSFQSLLFYRAAARWLLGSILLVSLTGAAAEEKGARERTFVLAGQTFDKAKTPAEFRQAAALFESLLAPDYENGAIYYNIGNAYLAAGDYGKALCAYRKAKLYRPRDESLEGNLKQALSLAPGRLPDAPRPWWKDVLFWSQWLSYPEKFQWALGAWAAAAGLAALGLFWRFRGHAAACAALLLAACFLSVDAGLAYYDVKKGAHAVVISQAIARKGDGPAYQPAFDQPLKDGAEFTIIDRRRDWVQGRFAGIGDGWLERENIVE